MRSFIRSLLAPALTLIVAVVLASCVSTQDRVIRADKSQEDVDNDLDKMDASTLNSSPYEHQKFQDRQLDYHLRVAEFDDDGLFFRQEQTSEIGDHILQEGKSRGAIWSDGVCSPARG